MTKEGDQRSETSGDCRTTVYGKCEEAGVMSEIERLAAMIQRGHGHGLSRRDVMKLTAAGTIGAGALAHAGRYPGLVRAQGEPRPGGTLTVATTAETPSLEPHLEAAEVRTRRTVLIYENLVVMDADLVPQPQLAESWEQPDDVTYVFKLREGVVFHNGKELDAEDVKYSYERLADPDVGSPGRGDMAVIDSITVEDKYTVRFTLTAPSASFLAAIGGRYSAVIPKDIIQTGDELRSEAVGTGPFMVEEWTPNQQLVLAKNPNYWQPDRPYLDQLVIQIIPDESSTVASLRTGDLGMAIIEDPQNYLLLQNDPNLVATRHPAIRWDVFDMACDTPPTDNPLVRRAILLALDKPAIAQAATQGISTIIGGIPPAMTLYAAPLEDLPNQTRDVEQAKALLAEAGYPDGVDMTLRTITSLPTLVASAQVIEANLREAGIRANIEPVELGVWINDWNAKQSPPTMNSWGGFTDPDLVYYRHFHSEPDGADFRRWNNEEADALLDAGRTTFDVEERQAIYLELQQLIAEDVPSIPLYSPDIVTVAQPQVQGYVQHPTGWYYGFAETWLAEE
jgi:peptide/nickel transport system substrate-binding protein